MILLNKTFKKAIASELFGGLFKATTNTDKKIDNVPHTGVLAAGSSLVAGTGYVDNDVTALTYEAFANHVDILLNNLAPQNLSIVTDHFLKVLDKVYTKIWNESFTETGIYNSANFETFYHGFTETNPSNFMSFKNFVSRAIDTGILVEEDRLTDDDQISIIGLTKSNISTNIDMDNETCSFNINVPAQLRKLLNAAEGQYLFGKKLNILFTPYMSNVSTDLGTGVSEFSVTTKEIREGSLIYSTSSYTHKPYSMFKPKTTSSKFGNTILLGTHLVWAIGTPEDKSNALIAGTPVPDVIFDHTDKISHLDKLTLKIKFGKVLI